MSTKMNDFYESSSGKFLTFSITKDGYYVVKYKDNWSRMRVVTENSLDVSCFLIDYGDIVIMPKNKIYQLVAEFMTIMAQVFIIFFKYSHWQNSWTPIQNIIQTLSISAIFFV